MAFEDHLGDAVWQKIYLLEIELGHRIDGDAWTQSGADPSWYIPHSEGEPSKVEEDGVKYAERANLADCNSNSSSWFWDSGNTRLYVHTSGSDDPGGASYIILSYFWVHYINMQLDVPIVFNGNYYLPYINDDNVPDIVFETSGYHEGGIRQSFGSIRLINADGYFDTRLTDYIHEAKKLIWRVGKKGDVYGDYAVLWRGWTGGVGWKDEEIEIEIEDMRRLY